jgi:methylated-DNA-protein-cysteine methyltransferase related protein
MPPKLKLDAKLKRQLLRDDSRAQPTRDQAIARVIASIPRGKVATYGQVAAAAGYPLHHRAAARVLRDTHGTLPWQRVVGAGGEIKTRMEGALEQRMRLEMEGVTFRGRRVDMEKYQHRFKTWEL